MYFLNSDPYYRAERTANGHIRHNIRFDEEGHIIVRNPSVYWLPEIKIEEEIDGTVYTVTGSYEGSDSLDRKLARNPKENQALFYNTHPAIIELDVFDKVQEMRQQRHRRTKTGKSHMFSGLVFCADCKAKMRYCTTNYFEERQDHFVCANYRSNTGTCSAHFIRPSF